MHSSFFRKPVAPLAALALAALLFGAPPPARADDAAAPSAGVGVARISLIHGQVAVQRGDSATATTAAINAPVLGADYVTTGDDSRAEVQFDAASAVRLGANVQMRFTHLDANDRELQLAEGTIDLRLLRGTGGRSQIDTPSISIRPRAMGSYRVTVDAGGATQVTVRSGSADIVTPQGADVLATGTTLIARGAAANPTVQRTDAIAYDDFDRFNADRDAREQRALADAYAPPGVAGVDDLDTYGRWVSDGGYGSVWTPSYVTPGWAPYRDGRWAWEDGYGWTWIGYEPWGWAPYHYGRWYHSPRYGWCWYPARAIVPWSPAIVTFVTFGGIGFGFNTIGWVPLAPFEPFNPWWGRKVTIVNNTFVTNNYYNTSQQPGNGMIGRAMYQNALHGGGTEISKLRFLEGRFEHARPVAPEKMRGWQVVRGIVPVVPSDANLRFSDRPVAAPLALRSTALRGTFAGDAIVPRRTPIEQQRTTIAHAALAPVRAAQPLAAQQPAAQQRTAQQPVTNILPAQAGHDPWARFGAERGIPVSRRITVIDGAAATGTASAGTAPTGATVGAAHPAVQSTRGDATRTVPRGSRDAADVWTRFDASSGAHQNTTREAVTVHDATAPREPVRMQQQPQRTYGERRDAPAYAAPRSVQYAVPVSAPPAQPARVSVPPAHANPAQHTERSTQHRQL